MPFPASRSSFTLADGTVVKRPVPLRKASFGGRHLHARYIVILAEMFKLSVCCGVCLVSLVFFFLFALLLSNTYVRFGSASNNKQLVNFNA